MNPVARALLGDRIGETCQDVVAVREPSGGGCHSGCAAGLCRREGVRVQDGAALGARRRVVCSAVGEHIVVVATPAPSRTQTPAGVRRVTPPPADRSPAPADRSAASKVQLTTREREVLHLVGEGFSTPEIARILEVRPATVRTHVEHVRTKLEAATRAEAVARAVVLGLIAPTRAG